MKTLTVMLHQNPDKSYLARGIIEDETVFEHVLFQNMIEFANYWTVVLTRKYNCILNIPAEWECGS